MSILLNDDELNALEGLRDVLIRLYIFGIKKYMDYQTGLVGVKRRISYQSLSENLYEEPVRGFLTRQKFSRAQSRRAIKTLEREGLIAIKSDGQQLILECILATSDKSVQNKAVTKPSQGRHRSGHRSGHSINEENLYNSTDCNDEEEKEVTQADCSKVDYPPQAVTPPLSDIRYIKLLTNVSNMSKLADGEVSTDEMVDVEKMGHEEKLPPCPHEKIIELYHQALPGNPCVMSWTKTRSAHLRARWKENHTVEFWEKFFKFVSQSKFLTGQVQARDRPSFVASLDWLIKPDNFAKVLEQKYHGK